MPDVQCPIASVVVPCLDEEGSLEFFYERTSAVLENEFGEHWEMLLVDDGSTDRTPAIIQELNARDPRVRGIRLSRNFGSHAAIAAGLDHVQGEVAIILAADLQDPPETIPDFVARWREGYEIVWGSRSTRDDPLARRIFAKLFYGVIVRAALPTTPRSGSGSFCLIDRSIVDSFRRFTERNRLTFGIIAWSGFSQTQVPYERAARHAGRTKWSLAMLAKTAIDTMVSFSYIPLRLITYFGFTVSLLAFVFGAYVIIDYAVGGTELRGWPSLMAAILFLGGAQLITLGVIGEYVWRVSEDTKGRPLYLVRDLTGIEPRDTVEDAPAARE
jgi:glycosyltransferase involved in cell wall biosynthesis